MVVPVAFNLHLSVRATPSLRVRRLRKQVSTMLLQYNETNECLTMQASSFQSNFTWLYSLEGQCVKVLTLVWQHLRRHPIKECVRMQSTCLCFCPKMVITT